MEPTKIGNEENNWVIRIFKSKQDRQHNDKKRQTSINNIHYSEN